VTPIFSTAHILVAYARTAYVVVAYEVVAHVVTAYILVAYVMTVSHIFGKNMSFSFSSTSAAHALVHRKRQGLLKLGISTQQTHLIIVVKYHVKDTIPLTALLLRCICIMYYFE
jgi:hypothetical protein